MKNLRFLLIYFNSLVQFSPRQFVLGCSLTTINTFCAGAGLLLLLPLLHYAGWLSDTPSQTPQIFNKLFHYFPEGYVQLPLLACLGLFIVLVTVSALIEYYNTQVMNQLRQDYLFHLQKELNSKIAHAEWAYIVEQKLKNSEHMLFAGLSQISTLTFFSLQFISAAIISFFYLVFSLIISVQLTLIATITALALFSFTYKQRAWARGQRNFLIHQNLHEQLSTFLEVLKLAKSYNTIETYLEHFNQLNLEGLKNQRAFMNAQKTTSFFTRILSAVIFSILFYVALQWLHIHVVSLVGLLIVFSRLLPRITTLQQNYVQMINIVPVFIQSREMLRGLDAHQEQEQVSHESIEFNQQIALEAVSFSHGEKCILNHVSCEFQANQVTAIVGHSGSGKSTLADILLGLLPPSSGSVKIDGKKLTSNQLHNWRDKISYIPQETHLFNDTLRANLIWAAPYVGDEEIEHALKLAALEQFVAGLPEGIETRIGDRGIHLSGGERQRLALARALLRKPRLLILDEATSALDAYNEELIYQTLKKLKKTITIILITHRWSTLRAADHLVVLHQGKIVEEGEVETLSQNKASHLSKVFQLTKAETL